jgi:hypothetical protein
MADGRDRLELRMRTIRVSFQAAIRQTTTPDGARARALELLDAIGGDVERLGDPELATILDETRRSIESAG